MLNNSEHPDAWALLIQQLDDARQHLDELIKKMVVNAAIDDMDFELDLGHVFAHLNRAWHSRNDPNYAAISQDAFAERSKFPTDLWPVG